MWNRHDSTSTKRAPANSLRSPQSKTNSLFWILDFLGNLGWLAPIVSPSASTRFPMPEAKSAYRRCFETLRSGTPTHARSAADAAFLESKMRMDPAMPRCRARFNAMTPGLMSLRPVLHDCSQNLCPAGNSRETTLDACRSLLARGKTDCDDAGCRDEIPEAFLLAIRKNEAFRAAFAPGFDYGVPLTQTIKTLVHDFNLGPSIKLATTRLVAHGIPNRFQSDESTMRVELHLGASTP